MWMGCEARKLGGSSAGRSETGVPDERGWDVKRANSLGGAPQEGARPECRKSVDGMGSVEIDGNRWGGRVCMGCETWK